VTAGTAVRVTPLIIDEQNGRGVMMSIDIQDGDLSSASVDRIPIVRRRTVNTQALVAEGTSLLIAGYTSEEKTNATSGVPVLSAIPVLGKLFQYSEKKQLNMERFYLLTPRLVVPGGAQAAPALPAAPAAPADAPPQG
jgi:type III secretion protein C